MVLVVFIQVVSRKFFDYCFPWVEEIATLMMVWFDFIGIAIGVLEKLHMSIELFTMKLSYKSLDIITRVGYVLISIFGALMIYFGVLIMNLTKKSLRTIAMVLALIATASMFGWLLSYLKIPAMVTEALLSISDNKIILLLLINLMCLFLGCIMDMGPLILILTPILLLVTTALGMNPIHFGAMLILNLAIGLCTPPVGAALFVGCSIGEIKIEQATKSSLPFYATMIIVLLLVTFCPSLVMTLPNLLS